MAIAEGIQSADWKAEKHAPVLEAPEKVGVDERFTITASVGKEIPHPNTTEHYISWIQVFFKPDGEKFTIQLADAKFTAHAESAAGANQGSALSEPSVSVDVKLKKSGTIHALSYCNIHGLWESEKTVTVG
jgi:superoxide reductase